MSPCFKHPQKEQYSQAEIDHLFTVLVSPNFIYDLPVYGASEPDLNIIQNFLDRCHKRSFISYPVSIKDLLIKLKNQDCKIFKKVTSINNHPLASYIASKKVCSYNLRKKQCAHPKINTERFISAFVSRLIFKHKLSTGQLGFYDQVIYFIMFFFYVLFINSCNILYVSLSCVK